MKTIYTLILGFLILFNISCQKETIEPSPTQNEVYNVWISSDIGVDTIVYTNVYKNNILIASSLLSSGDLYHDWGNGVLYSVPSSCIDGVILAKTFHTTATKNDKIEVYCKTTKVFNGNGQYNDSTMWEFLPTYLTVYVDTMSQIYCGHPPKLVYFNNGPVEGDSPVFKLYCNQQWTKQF